MPKMILNLAKLTSFIIKCPVCGTEITDSDAINTVNYLNKENLHDCFESKGHTIIPISDTEFEVDLHSTEEETKTVQTVIS